MASTFFKNISNSEEAVQKGRKETDSMGSAIVTRSFVIIGLDPGSRYRSNFN